MLNRANFRFDACYGSQNSWERRNKWLKKQNSVKRFS